MHEGSKFVGTIPIRVSKQMRAPRKLRHVTPRYPELPPQTSVSGAWFGEVLLDAKGKVAHIWTIREVRFKPPLPAFNQAIVDAIRQWEFEPAMVSTRAVPACMTVTININWP